MSIKNERHPANPRDIDDLVRHFHDLIQNVTRFSLNMCAWFCRDTYLTQTQWSDAVSNLVPLGSRDPGPCPLLATTVVLGSFASWRLGIQGQRQSGPDPEFI